MTACCVFFTFPYTIGDCGIGTFAFWSRNFKKKVMQEGRNGVTQELDAIHEKLFKKLNIMKAKDGMRYERFGTLVHHQCPQGEGVKMFSTIFPEMHTVLVCFFVPFFLPLPC